MRNFLKEYRTAKRQAFVFEEIALVIGKINSAAVPGCRHAIKHYSQDLRSLLAELKESG